MNMTSEDVLVILNKTSYRTAEESNKLREIYARLRQAEALDRIAANLALLTESLREKP